jgi:hypothetical protein
MAPRRWEAIDFTHTGRKEFVRIICAMPRASFLSFFSVPALVKWLWH